MTPALVALLLQVEAAHGLPPGLLGAVVMHESSGHARLVTPEPAGCNVGLGQVYVPGCSPATVQRLLSPEANLRAAALMLVRARERCRRHPRWRMCRPHWVGAYNGGSVNYGARVLRAWERLRMHQRAEEGS